ncbi:RNI-like protein [Gonapodya prolifera JEL478]|uniref:RNI-like protein n=1 Tax=Gonapodya prolifera (strain JEL478) TaxID=1344416 RepID=A0A139AL10_GONPJ|nr:RNI-like protein [Gonapodya prolifera JEL478]|eukprot:KXS17491.1 RNI-like protein [Gonapodya prolifera JEL478]
MAVNGASGDGAGLLNSGAPNTVSPSNDHHDSRHGPPGDVSNGADESKLDDSSCDADVVVAQLIDAGFPPDTITKIVSDLLSSGKGTYTTSSLLDESLAWLLQQNESPYELDVGRSQGASPPPNTQNLDGNQLRNSESHGSSSIRRSKSILKAPVPTPPPNTTIAALDGARSWLSKHLPTNIATIGNTLVNTLRSPGTALETSQPSSPTASQGNLLGLRVVPSDITPMGSHLSLDEEHARMSRRVRFSEQDVSVDPAADGPESPNDENAGEAGDHDNTEARIATVTEIYNLYMTECESYRETPIGKLVEQMQDSFERQVQTLTKIDLSGTPIGNKNVLPLAIILSCDFGLRQLSLENCSLDDDTLKVILHHLLSVDKLPWLNLSNNQKLTATGIKYCCIYVKKSLTLKYLDISGLAFDRTSVHYLAHAIAMGPVPANSPPHEGIGASLEVLKLDGCRLRSTLLEVLARSIAVSNLSYISLRRCFIDATGAQWVADMIPPDEDLRRVRMRNRRNGGVSRRKVGLGHLDVSENPLGPGVQYIAMALGLNSSVKQILMRDCKIDAFGLRVLSESLKVNHGLKVVNLSRNPCCGPNTVGIENLKDALAINRTIEELYLSHANVASEGAIALAEALPLTHSLHRLDLSGNTIDVSGLMALSATIRKNETITSVDLRETVNEKPNFASSSNSSDDGDLLEVFRSQIAAKCSENATRIEEEEERRRKELEASGTDEAQLSELREEEEQLQWEAEVAASAENLQRRQAESMQQARDSSVLEPVTAELALTARGFDRGSILEDLASAREGLTIIESILANSSLSTESDLLEQLYLQNSTLQSRLLAAVNDNLVKDEAILMEILALNDRLSPVLNTLEGRFQREAAAAIARGNSTGEESRKAQESVDPTRPLGQQSSAMKLSKDLFELGDADEDDAVRTKVASKVPAPAPPPKPDERSAEPDAGQRVMRRGSGRRKRALVNWTICSGRWTL